MLLVGIVRPLLLRPGGTGLAEGCAAVPAVPVPACMAPFQDSIWFTSIVHGAGVARVPLCECQASCSGAPGGDQSVTVVEAWQSNLGQPAPAVPELLAAHVGHLFDGQIWQWT